MKKVVIAVARGVPQAWSRCDPGLELQACYPSKSNLPLVVLDEEATWAESVLTSAELYYGLDTEIERLFVTASYLCLKNEALRYKVSIRSFKDALVEPCSIGLIFQ